jgi:Tfp pilus assembly protein PilO
MSLQLPAPVPPSYHPIPEWVPAFLAVIMLMIVSTLLLYPLIRAWARRIEGRGADPQFQEELMQLRERVAELEGSSMHVAELEERLDFTERMLAQRSDAPQLPMQRTPV